MEIVELFRFLTDSAELIRAGGYAALALIVFTETGLLIGFFLPGDSLLVTAGLFAAAGQLDIGVLIPLLFVAAVLGDATGYMIGRSTGPLLFRRADSRLFRRVHLLRSVVFYERHGGRTIVVARFVPIVRTFAPVLAGVSRMAPGRFALFNVTGGALWVGSMTLAGYLLGKTIPNVGKYMEAVILLVIALSLAPIAIEGMRARSRRRAQRRTVRDKARQLTGLVRHTSWEWSPRAVLATVAGINSARRAVAILGSDDVVVEAAHVVAGRHPRVEILVESTHGGLSESALELARIELSALFMDVVDEVGLSLRSVASVCDVGNQSHCWSLGNGHLTLSIDDSRSDPARIVVTIEPPHSVVTGCQASQLEAIGQ